MVQRRRSTSRSEEVRAKRKQAVSAPARQRKVRRGKNTQSGTPVMVRATRTVSNDRRSKRKNKNLKRRFDVALPTPGVEMRLPSLPSIKVSWRIFSLLLMIGFSALLYYVWTSPIFHVQDVQVEGMVLFQSDRISRSLLVYNKPIFLVDPQEIERQLLSKFDGLHDVSVQVGFPAKVAIFVQERQPMLIWIGGTDSQWIDTLGYSFPPLGDVENLIQVESSAPPPASYVPAEQESLEGVDTPERVMSPTMVASIIALSEFVPEGVALRFDTLHGFGWTDPAGWEVYFGMDDENMQMKLSIYTEIIHRLKADGVQPALVSLEYLGAPYYR